MFFFCFSPTKLYLCRQFYYCIVAAFLRCICCSESSDILTTKPVSSWHITCQMGCLSSRVSSK